MATAPRSAAPFGDADILLRVWEREKLTPTLARHLLRLGFCPEDKDRMHDLAVRNRADRISPAERQELDSYVRVGTVLSILRSRARKLLKKSPRPVNDRG